MPQKFYVFTISVSGTFSISEVQLRIPTGVASIRSLYPYIPYFFSPRRLHRLSEHLLLVAPQGKWLCLAVFLFSHLYPSTAKSFGLKYGFISGYRDPLTICHSKKFLKWTQINKVSTIVKFLSTVCKQKKNQAQTLYFQASELQNSRHLASG